MGEVRVRVKLINPLDEMRVRRRQLSSDKVHTYEANALVDTGAVRTIIPRHVLDAFDLELDNETVAEYAAGGKDNVGLSEPLRVEIVGRRTSDEALVLGDEVLIGQTVLEKLDLLVDCNRRQVVPNPAHPDQPVSKVK
ncbi:MAG: clan AA aspartic protease [Chthoniobacterales bacterium]|nr:clan AA aspartic protease [Chthoniobacterales bacterium]